MTAEFNIISREDAKAQGLKRYFTGGPCHVGHIDERLISSYQCMSCARIKKLAQSKSRRYYLPKIDKDGVIRNARPCKRCGCTDRIIVGTKGLYKKCAQCSPPSKKPSKENMRKWNKARYDRNPKIFSFYSSLRKKRVKMATPKWLTKEQKKEMADIYRSCPDGWEVDHLCPIAGENVSGLNVPWNLQHLTREENREKWHHSPWCERSAQPAFMDGLEWCKGAK